MSPKPQSRRKVRPAAARAGVGRKSSKQMPFQTVRTGTLGRMARKSRVTALEQAASRRASRERNSANPAGQPARVLWTVTTTGRPVAARLRISSPDNKCACARSAPKRLAVRASRAIRAEGPRAGMAASSSVSGGSGKVARKERPSVASRVRTPTPGRLASKSRVRRSAPPRWRAVITW